MGKEHPIIFTAESVKAILDGRKTMTRRVVKPQPKLAITDAVYKANIQKLIEGGDRVCPHGKIGDRLWVKETWIPDPFHPDEILYKADSNAHIEQVLKSQLVKWKPSIFMPRWASRLTLEITGVRVERLQEITEEDAIAEGIEFINKLGYASWRNYIDGENYPPSSAIESYRTLWNSINAKWKRLWNKELKIYEFWQFPWCAEDAKPIPKTAGYPERYHCVPNPWVWVIKFDNIGVRERW